MIDVVYVVRPGNSNPELRYSLRSLMNVPHGDVWIVGHRPPWVTGVRHVFVPQRDPLLHKYANNTAVITALAEHGPARFALMNDDFFCMRPARWPEPAHRGPLLELARERQGSYGALLTATGALLVEAGVPEPLAYTLHEPLPIQRDTFRLAVDYGLRNRAEGDALSWRSLYGNLARLGGERREDVKVHGNGPVPSTDWVSTSDCSFRYHRIGAAIRRAMATPGPYEQL